MTDRPIDFSSLDPTREAAAFDERARALADEAMSARQTPRLDVVSELGRWTRPTLAVAVVIAAGATFALVSVRAPTTAPEPAVDAVGIPRAIIEWTHANYHPSPLEVVAILGHSANEGAGQ
jgi:hypothetical protein